MKSFIILAIAVLVGLGVYWALGRGDESETPTNETTSNTQTQETQQKTYTLAEVAQHATKDNCWLAIEGKVYDVSDFVNNHPGGEAIVQGCGKDATQFFNNRPNGSGSHSSTARAMLPNYFIGNLAQ